MDNARGEQGELVGGYVLDEQIGRGGQADVFRAHEPKTGAVRALKIVRTKTPEGALRARREGEILSFHPHPGLPRCDAVFARDDTSTVLVLELAEGVPLVELLGDERITRERGEAILDQVLAALAHLHGRGIAHRDVKPENVIVKPDLWVDVKAAASVKLVDLGIANRAGTRKLTRQGVVGTASYLPPELLSGATEENDQGFARDLFAFGLMAHELLGDGYPPAVRVETVGAELRKELDVFYGEASRGRARWPPLTLGGRWGDAIDACLALDPRKRPKDANLVVAMTQRLPTIAEAPRRAAMAATERLERPPATLREGGTRLSWQASLGLIAGVGLAASMIAWWAFGGDTNRAAPPAASASQAPLPTLATISTATPPEKPQLVASDCRRACGAGICIDGGAPIFGSCDAAVEGTRRLRVCLSGVNAPTDGTKIPVDARIAGGAWAPLGTGEKYPNLDHCQLVRADQTIELRAEGQVGVARLASDTNCAICLGLKVPLSRGLEVRLMFREPSTP